MSSPFSIETEGHTEKTIESMDKMLNWAYRVDTDNVATELNLDSMVDDVEKELERVKQEYRIKTTEVEVENFVVNNEEVVVDILCGDLDEQVQGLETAETYINNRFGYVEPLDLDLKEIRWLVAQEVKRNKESQFPREAYESVDVESIDLDSVGECPEIWDGEEYPILN